MATMKHSLQTYPCLPLGLILLPPEQEKGFFKQTSCILLEGKVGLTRDLLIVPFTLESHEVSDAS